MGLLLHGNLIQTLSIQEWLTTYAGCISKVDSRVHTLVDSSSLRPDAPELEAIYSLELDFLQIMRSHANFHTLFKVAPPASGFFTWTLDVIDGVVCLAADDSPISTRFHHLITPESTTRRSSCATSVLTAIVLKLIDVSLILNLPKLHYQAASLLCSILSPWIDAVEPVSHRIGQTSVDNLAAIPSPTDVASAFLGFLDLLIHSVVKITDSCNGTNRPLSWSSGASSTKSLFEGISDSRIVKQNEREIQRKALDRSS
ncbi:unnamed protein product [Dicrocoelium dendriticum]|nr:unnamed protein product [Dicrocoelium dendriticum]